MRRLLLLAALLVFAFGLAPAASAQTPVVRAVLFYSPSCPHCHLVIEEVLPPLFETYGNQLEIIGIDASTEQGSALYSAAIQALNVPEYYRGVPMLFVGHDVLVGSIDIPEKFPGLIEAGLAQGGIDWPPIPELLAILPTPEPVAPTPGTTPQPTPAAPASLELAGSTTVMERIQRDLAGNLLSIAVLIGMLWVLVVVARRWGLRPPIREIASASWLIPLLSLLGMAVAIYLTVIELSGDRAVCGPVGDCNTVQQSPYAFLFGLLPVGALGVIGYALILLAWATARLLPGRAHDTAQLILFGLTLFGTLFSVYLTFLEPFVIGATCAWCLTSAVLQTALLWLTTEPARAALPLPQRRAVSARRLRRAT